MGLFDKKKSGKTAAETKLEEIVNRLFPGGFIEITENDGTTKWALREESALVEVWINGDFGSEELPILTISSPCVIGARDDDKLFRFLIETEEQSIFSKWIVFPGESSGTINVICLINLALSTLDDDEFGRAVVAVAQTSNSLDEEIVKKFGGQRAQDFFNWEE